MNVLKQVQAAHDEYGKWTGRIVHTSTTTSYDPQAKAWIKRTVEYIDLGRPDSARADPDAQLKPERFPEPDRAQAARAALRLNAIGRHAEIQAALIAYIMEHGPSSTVQMAEGTGLNKGTIGPHLSQRSGTIYERLHVPGHRHKVWNVISKEGGG